MDASSRSRRRHDGGPQVSKTMTPSDIAERLEIEALDLEKAVDGNYNYQISITEEAASACCSMRTAAATIRAQAEEIRKHESIAIHPDVEHYPLKAFIWKRDSTEEWVLQIEGTINDTCFVIRHPQPFSLSPEDAVGLPALYAQAEALKIATEALERNGLTPLSLAECIAESHKALDRIKGAG